MPQGDRGLGKSNSESLYSVITGSVYAHHPGVSLPGNDSEKETGDGRPGRADRDSPDIRQIFALHIEAS